MKRIDIRPYDSTLYFTTSRKEFLFQRSKYKSDEIDIESDAGVTSTSDNMIFVVGVFNGAYDTLAHELSHVIIRLFGHIGLNIIDESSEAFCYLLSDLMKECYSEMNKKTK